jgi:hypothetical protein
MGGEGKGGPEESVLDVEGPAVEVTDVHLGAVLDLEDPVVVSGDAVEAFDGTKTRPGGRTSTRE